MTDSMIYLGPSKSYLQSVRCPEKQVSSYVNIFLGHANMFTIEYLRN